MIVEITRSFIKLQIQDKTIKIEGEAYLPGYGSPDFVVYSNSIRKWGSPHEREPITEETKASILEILKKDATEKGLKIEIE